jgi:hypothetical protein
MDAEVVLRQKFHTYRQVQKTEKGRKLNKNEEALIKDAYKAGSRFHLEALAAAKRIGPRVFLEILQGHFFRQKSATIHQWLNLRPAIVLRPDTHASHPAPPCPPPLLRWFSSIVPRCLHP